MWQRRTGRRRQRPTVAVCVNTRDAEARLGRLLDEAAAFADEIVVGVDEASSDGTLDVARGGADVVYRFRHSGEMSPARMAALDHVSADWILQLDDDEGVDADLPALLPDLVADERYTHWWILRRWVVGLDPLRCIEADPWYPDYQLRLVRADPRYVWKPVAVHTGLRAVGPAGVESRASLLHYEPLLLNDADRASKLGAYRARGADDRSERYFRDPAVARSALAPAQPLKPAPPRPRRRPARLVEHVDDLDARPRHAPWNAVVEVRHDTEAPAGETVFATATARNTGTLAWAPPTVQFDWPLISLAYKLLHADGTEIPGVVAPRTRMTQWVEPGESAPLIARIEVPEAPGDYLLEWQVMCETDYWFTDCGAVPVRTPLRVTT